MSIEINTERQMRTVETREEALYMIEATAFSGQLSLQDLKEFPEVQKLAEYFNIDTDTIIIEPNPERKDWEHGFVDTYSFPKEG